MNYFGLIGCYGVTQEPNTQNYALVLPFMENGSLRSYLNQNFNSLTWLQKLEIMFSISFVWQAALVKSPSQIITSIRYV